MSKLLEVLGIAPVEETEEVKAVKAAKKEASKKVETEKEDKTFLETIKDLGKEVSKISEGKADEEVAEEELTEDELIEDEFDAAEDAEPTEEELAEFDAIYDGSVRPDSDRDRDYEDIIAEEAEREKIDRVSEEKIEEIKKNQERLGNSILGILRDSRPVIEEEDKMMEERNFYDEIGDMAYEYDRTGLMDVRLEDYIMRTAAKDKDMCLAFIDNYFQEYIEKNGKMVPIFFEHYLEDMLRQNPDWIPKVEEMIVRAAEDSMNIHVGFIRRVQPDDIIYSTLAEAKANIPGDLLNLAKELVLNEDTFFDKIWQEVGKDGEEIRRLTEDEVRDYIKNFRGDKTVLAKLLLIEDKEPEKKEKNAPKTQPKEQTASKGKPSPKKAE